MPTRRHVLRTVALAAASSLRRRRVLASAATFPSRRPPPGERRSTSPAVDATIAAVKREIDDAKVAGSGPTSG